ncbi:putative D-alanyl-D-alanine carboxypeptidase [Sinorhizobium fredii NGR234]|uniref:D-alanyl-D-alanine carboxypeptidase n=1 Tax=Sinorhizobium fredii (strain NBRC 101917 / NGR234) TaxID=394 RepID=C3MHI0_SINFN|nr:D-alanyl-D-alanine carboxypeptidase family protein [Sinorhizobium fredii]ACP24308.1 putative D-alanyl-D-alanine carboxypeptidase [Sinorhizobium fredii NGR234]
MRNLQIALAAIVAFVAATASAFAGSASFVIDARSGRVLSAENADELNYPASLTKMMTLYLTFEALHRGEINWQTPVPMSKEAARKPPTKLGLKPGSAITVEEAVYGMIIHSANDAAAAMAEKLGGSEAAFAQMMTAKARRLGMTRTVFVNASGLPASQQVTTARDMAKLGMALLRDFPREYRLFSAQSFNFRGRVVRGHNKLMYRYDGMDGIKTGYTNASGFNLVSAVRDGNRRVIGVVLGGRTAKSRDNKMAALLDQHLGRPSQQGTGTAVAATKPLDTVEVATLPGVSLYAEPKSGQKNASAAIMAASPTRVVPADRPTDLEEVASTQPKVEAYWQIQISTSPSAEAARKILVEAQSAGGAALLGASPHTDVDGSGSAKRYRARFIGFASREAATSACNILKKRAYDCQLLPGRS